MPKILKILLTIVALIAGIVLILFIISIVAGFESLGAMMSHIMSYLNFIWEERFLS